MKPISSLFLLLLILALWPRRIVTDGGNSGAVALISEACARTPYKDLCKASFNGAGKIPGSDDLDNLAKIAVKLAYANATDTQEHMKTLIDAAAEPFVHQCLMDCAATYDDAIGNLEDAVAALDSRGYIKVNNLVSAAMVDPRKCEGYFSDAPGHVSPLTSRNTFLVQLCSNALALSELASGGIEL
ncbi:hypothetical protein U1Q18_004271 [Sarracenia purpurea var. burkii]